MSRSYPEYPLVGVGAIIWRGDKVLLVRQDKYPALGYFWTLPGGAQELGETVADALHREVMEETGLTVEIGPLVLVADVIRRDEQMQVSTHYTVLDFRCEWRSGDAVAGSDAVEVCWAPLAELSRYRMWLLTEQTIRDSFHWQGKPPLHSAYSFTMNQP